MIWRERAKKKTYHLPRCLFTREDVGRSGISDEFRTGQSAFRTRSRGCGHGRVYLRQVTSSGTLAGSRPWKVRLQEDTGRVTFLQGNYSGCYVFVTALAYRAQSVRNEIRQQLPIFFLFSRFRQRSCENFMIVNYPFFMRLVLNTNRNSSRRIENSQT